MNKLEIMETICGPQSKQNIATDNYILETNINMKTNKLTNNIL